MLLKVKDLQVKKGYSKVEYIRYNPQTNDTTLLGRTRIPLRLFVKLHGEEYVVSYRYYDDTHSISIITSLEEHECLGEDTNIVIRTSKGWIVVEKEKQK